MAKLNSTREEPPGLSLYDLKNEAIGWKMAGEGKGLAPAYVAKREDVLAKLVWFLEQEELPFCGTRELQRFFSYLWKSHEDPRGRWGNAREREPLAASTVRLYHTMLRAFFRYLIRVDVLDESPMAHIEAPVARPDQPQPLTEAQQRALVEAAKRSRYKERNTALVLLMLDTGCRASEICGLTRGDVQLGERSCRVLGKGGKVRTVCFGMQTANALFALWRILPREEETPLFRGEVGSRAGQALTRGGLGIIIRELGEAAGIRGVRMSPHTLRHTAAVSWLLAGGDPFTLQTLLGHSSPSVTQRYVNLARADVQAQHRRVSPLDRVLQKDTRKR